jgi:hypothetical protein
MHQKIVDEAAKQIEIDTQKKAALLQKLEVQKQTLATQQQTLATQQQMLATQQQTLAAQKQILSAAQQQLEISRQQAVCIAVLKVLGLTSKELEYARNLAKPAETYAFDFKLPIEKQFVIKKPGMDILIKAATEAVGKKLLWNPGDFTICGNVASNIEGILDFIQAIPAMNVRNVVFPCELAPDALSALAKATIAAKGTLSVKLTHPATQEQFQILREKSAPAKSLPTPPPKPSRAGTPPTIIKTATPQREIISVAGSKEGSPPKA